MTVEGLQLENQRNTFTNIFIRVFLLPLVASNGNYLVNKAFLPSSKHPLGESVPVISRLPLGVAQLESEAAIRRRRRSAENSSRTTGKPFTHDVSSRIIDQGRWKIPRVFRSGLCSAFTLSSLSTCSRVALPVTVFVL